MLVDPSALDPENATAIDWFVPSPDGSRVAASLSRGGSEKGDVRVFETATGAPGDLVPQVNYATAAGGLAWDADGSGFFYTRYPRAGERPAEDQYLLRRDLPPPAGRGRRRRPLRAGPRLSADRRIRGSSRAPTAATCWPRCKTATAGSSATTCGCRTAAGSGSTEFGDGVFQIFFGPGDRLYLFSTAGAPRGRLLGASLAAVVREERLDLAAAKVVVPEGEGVYEHNFYSPLQPKVLVDGDAALPGRRTGRPSTGCGSSISKESRWASCPCRRSSTVSQLGPATARRRPGAQPLLPRAADVATASTPPPASCPRPSSIPRCRSISALSRWCARKPSRATAPGCRSRSCGGAAFALDGSHPALLTGYGGFGVSLTPIFNPAIKPWLDRGGVYAVANLRGGGEFGEAWHQAGALTHKQNGIDDFLACAERLVAAGYTRPERLAIRGASNGGLLMGAALTQRPDLFRAVVAQVGLYDMLRTELDANGVFNVPEYGSVKDPEQFRALHAYSPYHRVKDGAPYPALLLTTGANDARVNPMHSRKLAARLQAAGAKTVLLRTSATAGHGAGTSLDEQIENDVAIWSFLFDRLGMGI